MAVILEITSHGFSISLLCKHAMCNLQPELRTWYFDKYKFSPGSCFELKYTKELQSNQVK